MDKHLLIEIGVKVVFFTIFIVTGRSVILGAARNIAKGRVFDEKFLMTVAAVGSLALGEVAEAAAIMALYQLGEYLSDKAEYNSNEDISSLLALQSDSAIVLRGAAIGGSGQLEVEVPVSSVAAGDAVLVKPGSLFPCDGVITAGSTFIDKSAVTGEATPQSAVIGSEVFSGTTNLSSPVIIKVTRAASESFAQSVIALLKNCEDKKSHAEKFITRFSRIYTPVVCILALLVAIAPPVVITAAEVLKSGGGALAFFSAIKNASLFSAWAHKALMFLVVSCPCALVISVPVALVVGVARCAKSGAIIKGTSVLERLASVRTAVFDKTGTLTRGVFYVTAVHLENSSPVSEEELIALAAHAEHFSDHPVSKSLKSAHTCPQCSTCIPTDIKEIAGQGLSVTIQTPASFPKKFATLLLGNKELMRANDVPLAECKKSDEGTVIYAALDGKPLGHILISDKIKTEAKAAVARLKKLGVRHTLMLTGDNDETAKSVSKSLGLDEYRARLMPVDKVAAMEGLLANRAKYKSVMYFGDGVNDAPVIKLSDVGFAMGAAGKSAAVAAADVVIPSDNLFAAAAALRDAKKTLLIVKENIAFSIAAKVAIMALGALGVTGMFVAVFGDVGVSALAILNAMRGRWRKKASGSKSSEELK